MGIKEGEAQILEQRAPAHHVVGTLKDIKTEKYAGGYVETGIHGFDELFRMEYQKAMLF